MLAKRFCGDVGVTRHQPAHGTVIGEHTPTEPPKGLIAKEFSSAVSSQGKSFKLPIMARSDQLKALVRSHADGDDQRFYTIALQVAAQEARNGHGKLAQELRALIDEVRAKGKFMPERQDPKPTLISQPRGELAGLLSVIYPKVYLNDMSLFPSIRERLARVLTEQRQRDRIREHGLSPMRRLLLVGPPGTGKTMSSAALAGELGLPLFNIQLDGLITKFMGETSSKLRLIFDAVRTTRGVYFFDEFDAIGSARNLKNDVGEIRRVLNSFLQFLELDESNSLVVAATNHIELLDKALFRRFDAVIKYVLPSPAIAGEVMKSRLAILDSARVDWEAVIRASEGLSHAEIAAASDQAAKNAILEQTSTVSSAALTLALKERRDHE